MKNFEYLQLTGVREAAKALVDGEGARAMAGGTDLLDLMKAGLDAPERVVNLKGLTAPELRAIGEQDGLLRVGALVTLQEIAESGLLKKRCAVLAEAAAAAASPQLRNVGTLGGNLCQRPRCWYFRDGDFDCLRKGGDTCFAVEGRNRFHCVSGGGPCYIVHPSETAVALLALEAKVLVQGPSKLRKIALDEFYVVPADDPERETVLATGEIVTGVEIPVPRSDVRTSYTKFRFRESWDFAVVAVALALRSEGDVVKSGRISLGGVAPVPWLDAGTSALLAGGGASAADLAAVLLADAEPLAENAYKVPLARNLTRRAVTELLG